MIALTAHQVAEATGGRLCGLDPSQADQPNLVSVTTDSREVTDGTLFVAKPGQSTDGHLFVPAAAAAGACLSITEREIRDERGQLYPQVLVQDAVLAMGKLAHYYLKGLRQKNRLTLVAVTGSAGKTSTKDLLAAIFEAVGPTVAPLGSYNGEVGVPLTVFRANEDTRYLVIEMGADGVGHIDYLAKIVEPDHGVILKVGSAHAGEFGGVDNIEKTKGELAQAVGQTLALNDDDYRVRRMLNRTQAATTYFGLGPHNQDGLDLPRVYADHLRTGSKGCPEFVLVFPEGQSYPIQSQLIGEHHVYNLLAAATVAYQVGIDTAVIAEQLNKAKARSPWRMERTDRADGISVINDAYNANPESMAAALRSLAQLGRSSGYRTWAVLGSMLELGDLSVQEHDRLGRLAVRLNINKLVVVGQEARPIYNAAHLEGSWGEEATWVADTDQAFDLLSSELKAGDLVLFKSSNGAGLGKLGQRVAEADQLMKPASTSWLSAGEQAADPADCLSDGAADLAAKKIDEREGTPKA